LPDQDAATTKASRIKLIVLDNDGVLTDGRLFVSDLGSETKAFHIRDGFGVIMGRHAGLKFAIITGLNTPIVQYRAKQLGIDDVRKGFVDKLTQMKGILSKNQLEPEEAAYMGDDLFDLPVMGYVGLGAAPADAHPLVIEHADWVSPTRGGHGAVRDLIEFILKARGDWDRMVREFAGV
jgi:3-deoxy-D-manno-octulosonate 8-phosphate phosphatase (KDO 8-P phosphatase)